MLMPKRKKSAPPLDADDGSVSVRVSPRAPHARTETPPITRAQNLATGLLEAFVGQLADYIATSPAVEKLIRAQTRRVLQELAHDAELTRLIRAQADQYLAELTAHPERLEPLVRSQVEHYLDYLLAHPARLRSVALTLEQERAAAGPGIKPRTEKDAPSSATVSTNPSPSPRKRKPRTRKLIIE
jgi:hypothetical protein